MLWISNRVLGKSFPDLQKWATSLAAENKEAP
jgi:hypothetical protein